MANKTICDGEAIRFGWKKTTENLGLIIGVTLACIVTMIVSLLICSWIGGLHRILGFLFTFVYFGVFIYISVAFLKVMLKIVDGKPAGFGDLLVFDMKVLLNFFLTVLLNFFIVFLGALLFIIPGMILALKFKFAPLLAIDKGLGPIEALKKSSAMTDGLKWDLFGFYFVSGIVIYIGVLALGIGVLLSIPTAILGFIYIYRQLSA